MGHADRPQKITFAEMRDRGVRGLLIYCSDYKCSRLVTMSGDRWPEDIVTEESVGIRRRPARLTSGCMYPTRGCIGFRHLAQAGMELEGSSCPPR
jgi:hypothetical protein